MKLVVYLWYNGGYESNHLKRPVSGNALKESDSLNLVASTVTNFGLIIEFLFPLQITLQEIIHYISHKIERISVVSEDFLLSHLYLSK